MANEAEKTTRKKGFAKFWQYLREVRLEIKKVTWPTHRATLKSTALVLVVVIISAAILYGFDRLLIWIASLIQNAVA